MAVLVWSESDGALGNIVRSGRRVMLSAEEFREEAEALDAALDEALDMAWQALTIITERVNGSSRFNSFEQVWMLARAVRVNGILQQEGMRREVRTILWEALVPKCWYGVRADLTREPRWRSLLPPKAKKWQTQPREASSYRFMEIGYWLQEQSFRDASDVFDGNYAKAQDLHDRTALRSLELRQAILRWIRQQRQEVRDELGRPFRGKGGFAIITKFLTKRFPSRGPGSARLPQHYPTDQLQAIVDEVLDAARDEHFAEHDARA